MTFTNPVDLAQFSAADDKDNDNCTNGFQHDVVITTAAPNGTSVQLFAGAVNVATVAASGGQVTFPGVQLAASGDTVLSIQFPSTMPCTAASTKAKVSVDCSVPTCSITKPVISGTHPALNGVPAASGGDRVSGTGSPYEAAFEVTTNIANNQNVFLDINNSTTPATVTSVTAKASGGKAVFTGVALPPGTTIQTYQIQARCIDANGVVGRSTKGSYPVDATPPDLTVSKPTSGEFIGPSGLPGGAFQVCGSTLSSDAVALPPGLGSGAVNFCASVSGSPICKAVPAVGTSTCVNVACPGDAPFNITVTLTDGAGNPQTQTINGVTCSSTMPNVQIISPVSDAPAFNDPTRHLLSATAAQPFRDQTGAVAGAQTDVVACSSRGGTAALLAGHAGDGTLIQVGGTVATAAATALDGCPSGLGFVAKFLGVTLPESNMDAAGVLTTATQIRVDVTDVSSSVGTSSALNLWVDSVAPTFALTSPVGLCGSFQQAFATYDTSIVYSSDTPNITLSITNGSSTDTHSAPSFASGVATFPLISFNQGQSNLAAVANDAAGNKTAAPQPCTVTAGIAPVVLFTTPTSTNQLCPANGVAANCIDDADANTAGWQGSLSVRALVGGLPITTGNITFSAGGAPLGTAPLNATGDATLNNVTLFDGTINITAQTPNIPGNGIGVGTLAIVVDLGGPTAPTSLTAGILDRRQTSFQLFWNAPDDNGQPVAGYEVRYAKVPLTTLNFDNPAIATPVAFAGSPSAVGQPDGIAIENLYIENGYYFGVAAIDAAGNRSTIASTPTALTAHFNVTTLTGNGSATEGFGFQLESSGDVNNDGHMDLIVAAVTGQHAYLYLGSASGTPPSAPSVIFSGDATVPSFGRGAAIIGDIDNDGIDDIAISNRATPPSTFIYKGRANWLPALSHTNADYVITADASYNASSLLGGSIARLGDFTGDGIDDFVMSAYQYNGAVGRIVIVKGKAGFGNIMLPDPANTIVIDGDSTVTTSFFGYRVLGLGHFFNSTPGTTLIVSAPGTTAGTAGSEGRVYAFHGQGGTAGVIPISAADEVVVGNALRTRLGTVLTNLGPLWSPLPAVGSGNPGDRSVPSGSAWLFSGDVTTGPLASHVTLLGDGTNLGTALIGGGLSGMDQSFSLIGDGLPDVIQIPVATPPFFYIIDGKTLRGPPALTSPISATLAGSVAVPFPASWVATAEGGGKVLPDISGDTYPDFAITNGTTTAAGKVLLYW